MSIKEIIEFRKENLQKEEEMWIAFFNETYPIGKIVEIQGEEMEVIGYCYDQTVPTVKFDRLLRIQKYVPYFELPEFKEGGDK